jgi:hypothetical protein
MQPDREHPNHRLALKAWGRGDHSASRELWHSCIAHAERANDIGWLTFYLQGLAQMEGETGNHDAFHAFHQRALALQPDAPMLLLFYARDLWTVLKDKEACLKQVQRLEALLASDRWDRTHDLAPLAYQKKIETLKAWTRGEPGGPLWP